MPQLAPSSLPPGPTMAGPLLVRESGATLSVHGLTVAHSGSRPIQCRLAAATSGRARARWFGALWHLWVRTIEAAVLTTHFEQVATQG